MHALISVIVPAYNIEEYIIRCLESISNQTYPNIEIIVVDDGSCDNTSSIIDAYACAHSNVRIIHKENAGVTAARLSGVAEANGEWIGFVDGDDEIECDMYERLLANAETYNAQISHCGYRIIFPDGRSKEFHNSGRLIQHDNLTGIRELLSGVIVEPGLWNKLFHKSLLETLLRDQIMDLSIKTNEDLLMNFYLFRQASVSVFEDFCPYHYLIRTSSATRKGLSRSALRDPIRVKKIILDQIPDSLATDAKRAYLSTCITTCNRIARETGNEHISDYRKMRSLLWEHRAWISLLGMKNRIMAILILLLSRYYSPIYRVYFQKISKQPYD